MRYEVKQSRYRREWVVEGFDSEGDERVYVAKFSGPGARERAIEYGVWKNSVEGHADEASKSVPLNSCLWTYYCDGHFSHSPFSYFRGRITSIPTYAIGIV